LKSLNETTLKTFFEVARAWGLKEGVHFKYNIVHSYIRFFNGSEILLKELDYMPSDPLFDRLGSLEISFVFIDEANQVTAKAKNVIISRIRHKLDEFGIIPKALFTSNPCKNWPYIEFYKPFKSGKLLPYRKFVQALATDNPFVSRHYIENLLKLDINSKERLLKGNWEYDDDPNKLFEYNTILDLFTNTAKHSTEFFVSCDAARIGKDKAVIMLWRGLQIVKVWVIDKCPITGFGHDVMSLEERLFNICAKYGVRRSHVVVDEDGMGGGIIDSFSGCKGFVNNSSPVQPREASRDESLRVNYQNLKTQCYFEFARQAENGTIGIRDGAMTIETKEALIEELEQIKQKDADKDGKIKLVGKDVIKELIGRSPDISDTIMMRMIFLLNKIVVPDLHLV